MIANLELISEITKYFHPPLSALRKLKMRLSHNVISYIS